MMKMFLLLLFLFFPLQGCYSQNQEKITQEPKITDPYSWDFGQAEEGEILKHNFTLKNDSPNNLNILNTTTSCGCTVSKVEKNALLPGESTFLEVQFNTKGFLGPTQKTVDVHTDKVDNPVIKFTIKAKVIPSKEDQNFYDFGQVEEGEVVRHNFVLRNEYKNTLNIQSVNTSCACTVSTAEKNTLLPGESSVITVHFNTKGYSGEVWQYTYVNTDKPENPVLRFIIKANVVK